MTASGIAPLAVIGEPAMELVKRIAKLERSGQGRSRVVAELSAAPISLATSGEFGAAGIASPYSLR